MKKLIVLSLLFLSVSCTTQNKVRIPCDKKWKWDKKFETLDEPKDSVRIRVSQTLNTYAGRYVKSDKGKWYSVRYNENEVVIFDSLLVFREWESLPPCY